MMNKNLSFDELRKRFKEIDLVLKRNPQEDFYEIYDKYNKRIKTPLHPLRFSDLCWAEEYYETVFNRQDEIIKVKKPFTKIYAFCLFDGYIKRLLSYCPREKKSGNYYAISPELYVYCLEEYLTLPFAVNHETWHKNECKLYPIEIKKDIILPFSRSEDFIQLKSGDVILAISHSLSYIKEFLSFDCYKFDLLVINEFETTDGRVYKPGDKLYDVDLWNTCLLVESMYAVIIGSKSKLANKVFMSNNKVLYV